MTAENITRQPRGIPAGGQFAATAHAEPNVNLNPVIEDLSFDHEDSPFEVERDGDGRYTIYATTDEGEDTSFRYGGDPADRAALEAAAAAALADEGAALRHREAISKVDAAVHWTNPETGQKTAGRSIGEVDNGLIGFQVPGSSVPFTAVPAHELEVAPPAPPAAPVKFTETQRRTRGHNFYAPKAIMSKVPALGSTKDVPFEDKKVHLHYFTGGADWYLTELDQRTGTAFGFLNPSGNGGHWGYVNLPDLEAVSLGGYRVVERDCHFSQGNLAHATRYR